MDAALSKEYLIRSISKTMKNASNKLNSYWPGSEALVQASKPHRTVTDSKLTVFPLAVEDKSEVLAFLAERPTYTFGLAGFVRDNGLVNPLNRGTFYGCRNEEGQLVGVALIGHATLFETRSDRAIELFARLAQECPKLFLLLGEQEKV